MTPDRRLAGWPRYLAAGLGIQLAVLGGIEGVYGLSRGAGLAALIPMGISVAGLLLYQWSEFAFMRWQHRTRGTAPRI